ncbi:hypothetical protein M758_9G095500 [Ceratodon purpureus]|nr:hypothetical protein M758_9G095500 [Ceratodon purpureus]
MFDPPPIQYLYRHNHHLLCLSHCVLVLALAHLPGGEQAKARTVEPGIQQKGPSTSSTHGVEGVKGLGMPGFMLTYPYATCDLMIHIS